MGSALYQYITVFCGNHFILKLKIFFSEFQVRLSIEINFFFHEYFKVNLCTIGYGLSVGWIASAFLIFDSDDCPLPTGRIPMGEIAWVNIRCYEQIVNKGCHYFRCKFSFFQSDRFNFGDRWISRHCVCWLAS